MRYDFGACQYKHNPVLFSFIHSHENRLLDYLQLIFFASGKVSALCMCECVCVLTFKLKDKVCCTGQLFFSRPLCESLGYTAATEIQGVGDHHHSYPHG